MEEIKIEIERARELLREAYYGDVQELALSYKERLEAKEFSSREEFVEDLNQALRAHSRVLYPAESLECLRFSGHDSQFAEIEADSLENLLDADDKSKINWALVALYAIRQDVADCLEELGVDTEDFPAKPRAEPPPALKSV